MFKKYAQNTLHPSMTSKSIRCGQQIQNLNHQLTQYFTHTYQVYEQLFTIIKNQPSYYSKPQPLRHPLIFYYGHTACFYINKLMDCGLLKSHVNQVYEQMFAVGVDENDWDDMEESHYDWPKLEQVKKYRAQVKKVVLELISQNKQNSINSKSPLWAFLMAIDHQKIHLQTSAAIIRRLKPQEVHMPDWFKECPFQQEDPKKVPQNGFQNVPSANFQINISMDRTQYYGWDCNFGYRKINVKQFKASKMLVSNSQYLHFYLENGYQKENYWTSQGWNWLSKHNVTKPIFWIVKEGDKNDSKNYKLKTLTGEINMPWDWPVQVNNHQARAFCAWKSQKTGKKLRLPTQDQYLALAQLLKTDCEEWQYQSVGNINLQFWSSPCPVNMFQIQGFYDIVGNVLQHTQTPLFPYQNFQIHPLYEDFTTPLLDNRHDLLRGGSFMSTGNSASKTYRPGFRRHFYLFSGFRYVESENPSQIQQQKISQSDQSLKKALQIHYIQNDSYIQQVIDYVYKIKNEKDGRLLVVGCLVGRMALQLASIFGLSFGIDYTARFFQMAAHLLEKGTLSYKGLKINLSDLKITQQAINRVKLYQMNPVNVDKNKINEIDWMIFDGFNIKKGTILAAIKKCFTLFKQSNKKKQKDDVNERNLNALIIVPDQETESNFQVQLEQQLSVGYKLNLLKCFGIKNQIGQDFQTGKVYHFSVQRIKNN